MSDDLTIENPEIDPAEEKDWTKQIEAAATRIVGLGLEMPVVFLLESHMPVHFLISQSFVFHTPISAPVFGGRIEDLAKFFEKIENLDRLIKRIEQKSDEKRLESRLLKPRKKRKD